MSTTTSSITCDGLVVNGTISATGAQSSGALTATSVAIGSGTVITKILKGVIAVTVSALADGAEEDVSLTIANSGVTDAIIITPLNAGMETGLAVVGAWCSTAGTVKVRFSNVKGSGLTGSTSNWNYCLIQS